MKVDDYQKEALRTDTLDHYECLNRIDPTKLRLLHSALGMHTEAAEFADALKKHIFYGKPLDFTNLKEEVGDLLWYIAIACDTLRVPMGEIMERNIKKLRVRYPDKFNNHDATNRDLDAERKVLEGKVLGIKQQQVHHENI